MIPPHLKKYQYAVLIAEYSTGIVYNKFFQIYQNGDDEKEVYQVFNSFEEAICYIKEIRKEQNKFEYVIYDNETTYLCTIDQTTDLNSKIFFLEKIKNKSSSSL